MIREDKYLVEIEDEYHHKIISVENYDEKRMRGTEENITTEKM